MRDGGFGGLKFRCAVALAGGFLVCGQLNAQDVIRRLFSRPVDDEMVHALSVSLCAGSGLKVL